MRPRFRPRPSGLSGLILLMPAGLLVLLFLLPVLALLAWSASPAMLSALMGSQAYQAIRVSLLTSLVSTAVVVLLGTPLAFALARWAFPGRKIIDLLVDLPVVLPPSVAGLALLMAFGRRGLLGGALSAFGISLPFTTAAVVLAQLFVAGPLYIRTARIGFASVDLQMEEAAVVEGANQWQIFQYIMLPQTRGAMVSGALLSWTRALGEFGATILFAGNLSGTTQTMPLAIYLALQDNLPLALALSVLLMLVSGLVLWGLRYIDDLFEDNEP